MFPDDRGLFYESWNARRFTECTGVTESIVEENHSRSINNVLDGFGHQINKQARELVRVVQGVIFDVAVDLRRKSKTFGSQYGVKVTESNHLSLWVPPVYANGFLTRPHSANAVLMVTVLY